MNFIVCHFHAKKTAVRPPPRVPIKTKTAFAIERGYMLEDMVMLQRTFMLHG